MHAGGGLAGPALTVKTRPGDNLMLHKALDLAEAGDVIVVDAGGDLTNSLMGELMLAHAEMKQLAGIVIYGAVRDVAYIRSRSLPVFAAGVTHRGPYKDGPGEINVPIAIEGMVIHPGDLVLGDDDGVLCVPFDDCEQVYVAAKAKSDAEQHTMQAILAGTDDRTWVDATLQQAEVRDPELRHGMAAQRHPLLREDPSAPSSREGTPMTANRRNFTGMSLLAAASVLLLAGPAAADYPGATDHDDRGISARRFHRPDCPTSRHLSSRRAWRGRKHRRRQPRRCRR